MRDLSNEERFHLLAMAVKIYIQELQSGRKPKAESILSNYKNFCKTVGDERSGE